MKRITAEITGDNNLLGRFTLQHAATRHKDSARNVKAADFDLNDGEKYVLLIEIEGDSGQKYKIAIKNSTKATYPADEQISQDGRDLILVRITG